MTIPTTEPALDRPYEDAPWGVAFRRFWKKGFTFTGRASRSEFWRAWVLTTGIVLVAYLGGTFVSAAGAAALMNAGDYSAFSTSTSISGFLLLISGVYSVAVVIPSIAITVRRLHDVDRPGGYYFVCLIPFIGSFILLGMLAQASRPEGVRFDESSSSDVPREAAPRSSYGEISTAPGLAPSRDAAAPPSVPVLPTSSAGTPPFVSASPTPSASAPPPVPVPTAPSAAAPAPVSFPSAVPTAPAQPAIPVPPTSFAPATPAQAGSMPFAPAAPPSAAPAVAPVVSTPPLAGSPISSIPGMPASPAVPPATSELDATRYAAPRGAQGWALDLPDGRRLGVDGAISVGRDPVSEQGGVLVPIDDPARSMSKTHARFELVATGVTVTDLHSTNGTRIASGSSPTVSVAPGSPTPVPEGATVVLGEYAVRVTRR